VTAFEEKARWWSYHRQRLGQRASDAEQALRSVVGVYSSHPTAPLSLHARVYNEAGDGLGVVLVDGEAAGAWEARFAGGGGRMRVDLDLFERPGAVLKKAVEYRFEVAASLLGARSVSMD
jgi:hypothetical protein